jgi:iron complex outermembrane receptor protein
MKYIYVNVKDFRFPSVAETLFERSISHQFGKPEIGWNYELGFKGTGLK